jgi:hypothetical protein
MTNQHPIVPSPEQVDQWFDDAVRLNITPKYYIARQASLWSADQELEACCEWLSGEYDWGLAAALRLDAELRPDPPSLKEQALEQLDEISNCFRISHGGPIVCDKIRKALEALPND